MYHGDSIGAAAVLQTMERLGEADERFAPAPMLKELAAYGGSFLDIDTGGLKVGK